MKNIKSVNFGTQPYINKQKEEYIRNLYKE